jgi:hypothetical protein
LRAELAIEDILDSFVLVCKSQESYKSIRRFVKFFRLKELLKGNFSFFEEKITGWNFTL